MTKVIQESDVTGWPIGHENDPRYFQDIVVSADGTKVGFVVRLNFFTDKRIYVMNADGSGLVDLTGNLPLAIAAKDIANLQINDTGSRLFFRDYSLGTIYYFDTASHASSIAYLGQFIWPDARKPYTLNSDGSRLFFQHKWAPADFWHYGLAYADTGTNTAVPVFDVQQLNPPANWNFRYLGGGKTGATLLFSYYPDTDNKWAMFKTGLPPGTPATRVPDENHIFVWGEQDLPNNIVSADGNKALYACQNYPAPEQLYAVNLASGAKTLLAADTGGSVTFPAMSPNGAFARFTAYGYYATRINLATLDKRDTFSYWFGEANAVGASNLTDITANNRFYFVGSDPSTARIHRIDMAPAGSTGPAPDITAISFSKPYIILDDTNPVTITVKVSDPNPGGLGNIQWVKMHTLVDGREFPAGQVYEPLSYNNVLTDAGGGTFTTTATANKFFFQQNPTPAPPRPIGVRIVVKNNKEHYVMADAVINVTTRGALSGTASSSLLLLDE